jgi:hypothetical protein
MNRRVCLRFAEKLLDWLENSDSSGQENIFVQEFCLKQGFATESIQRLRQRFPDFNALMRFADEMQEIKLNKLTLSTGKSTGAMFLLKNHYGYGEKNATDSKASPPLLPTVDTPLIETASDEELREMMHYYLTKDDD